MADPRFYTALTTLTAGEVALACGSHIASGDADRVLTGVAAFADAGITELSFLEAAKGSGLVETGAGACLVRARDTARLPRNVVCIETNAPRLAFATLASRFVALRSFQANAPSIDPTAMIATDVVLGPGVVIGPDVMIGEGTRIGANTVIGPGVCIGRSSTIGHNVTLLCCLIGDRVSIGSGSIIGEAGFGIAMSGAGHVDVPQLGRVIIQDRVTLGAAVCVDRGAFGDTIVGEGSKIDNQVQIAHNCVLGRGVVMAAQSGLAGSVTLEDGVVLGGQVGVADHTTVGAGAVLMGKTGTFGNVPAGEVWGGYPARPRRTWLRETASVAKLARRGVSKTANNEGDQ